MTLNSALEEYIVEIPYKNLLKISQLAESLYDENLKLKRELNKRHIQLADKLSEIARLERQINQQNTQFKKVQALLDSWED